MKHTHQMINSISMRIPIRERKYQNNLPFLEFLIMNTVTIKMIMIKSLATILQIHNMILDLQGRKITEKKWEGIRINKIKITIFFQIEILTFNKFKYSIKAMRKKKDKRKSL